MASDAWTHFVDETGAAPDNVFQLVNFSRSNTTIAALSYNKALIIFEKHTQSKLRRHASHRKKQKLNKSKLHIESSQLALSTTSPTSPTDHPSSLSIEDVDAAHDFHFQAKPSSSPSSPTSPLSAYRLDELVLLSKDREGLIRFIGDVHFTKGTVYGIELTNGSIGKHDGIFDGQRYFQTASQRGIFVKGKQIRRRLTDKDKRSSYRLRRLVSIEKMNGATHDTDSIPPHLHRRTSKKRTKQRERRRSSSAKRWKRDKAQAQTQSSSSSNDEDDIGVAMKAKRKRNTMGSQELPMSPMSPKGMRWSQKGDETVDDMVIDDYFNQTEERKQTQPEYNRVHSRIPAKQPAQTAWTTYNPNAAQQTQPLSFRAFRNGNDFENVSSIPQRAGRSETIVLCNEYNTGSLQKRRSREHLLHYGKQHHARHGQHALAHSADLATRTTQRRGSTNSLSKHKKQTASMNAMSQMKSAPGLKHSRFASVTNVLSRGWNFAKSNKGKGKGKKKKGKGKTKVVEKPVGQVFGVDPGSMECVMVEKGDYGSAIPSVLERLKRELGRNDGLGIEGIFRVAPNAIECKRVEGLLDEGKVEEIKWDAVPGALTANLIKIWFRKMPRSVLQDVEAGKIEGVQNSHSVEAAERIVEEELERGQRALLLWLLDLCLEVTARESENKMSDKNMAVVVSPNLYDPTALQNPMKAMSVSQAIVDFMVLAMRWRRERRGDEQ